MDEERRTTVNLKACIRQARERVVFINTGFLDRTGDEIHTSMEAGPMIPKMEIKTPPWILAYEDWNVDVGIATGFPGTAQIGKGMWTMPDRMSAMMEAKIAIPGRCQHGLGPLAHGRHAACAALSRGRRRRRVRRAAPRGPRAGLATSSRLLCSATRRLRGEIQARAGEQRPGDPRLRGALGGAGDRLLEDPRHQRRRPDGRPRHAADLQPAHRQLAAACRRSRGTRWSTRSKMAAVVDRQNSADPRYQPMATDFPGSPAFKAALDLVFTAEASANGYTEEVLHARRKEVKSRERSP